MSNNYILDLGSWEIKCGTDDLNLPVRLSSYIGYHLFPGPQQQKEPNIYGQFDPQKSQYYYQQSINNGIIFDIEQITNIYETCLNKTNNNNFKGNLVFPIQIDFQPRKIQELAQVLFDKTDIQSISFPLQPFCAFQYFGQDTGCIIEIGNEVTQCMCILKDQDLQNKSKYNFGAKHVQVYLKTLMQNDGSYVKPQMSQQIEKDILENFCQNLPKRQGHLLKLGEHSGPLIDEVPYIFPDGQEILLGDERYMAPEVTYQPDLYGLNFKGLQHLIVQTISQIDNDLRLPMYNNLLISGGYTNLKGFPERLTEELQDNSPSKCKVGLKYSNENRQNLVWKGASILSESGLLENLKITKKEFEENGLQSIEKRHSYLQQILILINVKKNIIFYTFLLVKLINQSYTESHNIPAPEKENYGGEDAHYNDDNILSVADGVGGWNEVGVNPALYSRKLIQNVKDFYQQNPEKYAYNPKQLLIQAANNNNETGSSTLIIATLNPRNNNIQIANIGDSGFAIFRKIENKYQMIKRSTQQQHSFNFPYQIGTEGDEPQLAQDFNFDVQENDLILLGSDGLFDNVFDEELEEIINESKDLKNFLYVIPNKLAKAAYNHSLDTNYESPFQREAQQNNFLFEGGKSDDISVILAQIVKNDQLNQQ